MGLGAHLRGRPAPGPRAVVGSILVLVSAPLAFAFVFLWLAFNTRPSTGTASVTLLSIPVGETAEATGLGQTNVTYGSTVDLDVAGARIGDAYYLVSDLAYGAVLLGLILAGIVAVAILLRHPFSRVVAAALALLSAYAVAAAFAGPAARQWAVDRTIETTDAPTSAASAREAGVDFFVLHDVGDWTPEWYGGFIALAVAALGAALYVLHARRLTAISSPQSPESVDLMSLPES